ncbi:MAG: single-stranded-DNA-specific exonuclease RecJ [Microscillaceae bacterium]
MEKKWIYKPTPPPHKIKQLAEAIRVDETLATLLGQRNIFTYEEARSFFRPRLEELHNPFLMKGMHEAVARLEQSMVQKEKVLIYGDYDVDGTTAVALVYGFLQGYHPYLDYYIPDRQKEGYGISQVAIDWAESQGFSLIIALDCGIKSVDMVVYAASKGIDFIICDHHLPGDEIPPAYAVLDPKQPDCPYPFKELSGCGIGYKLMQAFCEKNHIEGARLHDLLDLVVVSIAADIVPIIGENRILAYFGLQKLNHTPRAGLKALIAASGFSDEILLNIRNLVFNIGPRINAVGRLQHAKEAVELLISNDKAKAEHFAGIIDAVNTQRKDLDSISTLEALEMIAANRQNGQSPFTTVLFKPDWHKGILGIVASRCIEYYHRPTIILTQDEDGKLVGSARSSGGFDLYRAIESCADLLLRYGGHQQAAGLTMEHKNLETFRERFENIVAQMIQVEQLAPLQEVDLKISLAQITHKFYRVLKQFAPFGPKNMRPVFVTEQLVAESPRLLREKHLSFKVKPQDGSYTFRAIGFGMGEYYQPLTEAQKIDLCYTIEENVYQGRMYLQLRVKDIRFYA